MILLPNSCFVYFLKGQLVRLLPALLICDSNNFGWMYFFNIDLSGYIVPRVLIKKIYKNVFSKKIVVTFKISKTCDMADSLS